MILAVNGSLDQLLTRDEYGAWMEKQLVGSGN
jgi:hypothetical protein